SSSLGVGALREHQNCLPREHQRRSRQVQCCSRSCSSPQIAIPGEAPTERDWVGSSNADASREAASRSAVFHLGVRSTSYRVRAMSFPLLLALNSSPAIV